MISTKMQANANMQPMADLPDGFTPPPGLDLLPLSMPPPGLELPMAAFSKHPVSNAVDTDEETRASNVTSESETSDVETPQKPKLSLSLALEASTRLRTNAPMFVPGGTCGPSSDM